MYNHQTCRRYTAALMDVLNHLKVQHLRSDGSMIEKNVPVMFSSREKSEIFSHLRKNNLYKNANILPRAYLNLIVFTRDESRVRNRSIKTNISKFEDTLEYAYAAQPFTFNYDYAVMCRGYTEATQIAEEIIPWFNPTLPIDVWDCDGLKKPTRIIVSLTDASIEPDPFEEYSTNTLQIHFMFDLYGWIYPPPRTLAKVKEFQVRYHLKNFHALHDYDVVDLSPDPATLSKATRETSNAELNIIDIEGVTERGMSYYMLKYTAQKGVDVSFKWDILNGDSDLISYDKDKCQILVKGDFDIKVTIKDEFDNECALVKAFTV